jgi:pimeloyl-ACP methyl ester carboxylesterase
MDGTGHLFDAFLKCLSAGNQTKIVSYPAQAYLSYEQLEELVVRELPVSGKYIIIAESFSGPIALRLASRAYGDLVTIVLVSSFAYRPLGWKGSLLARLPLSVIFRLPFPDFVLRTFLLGSSASADDLSRARQVIGQVRPQVLASRLKEALTSDYGKHQIHVHAIVRVVAIFAEYDHLLGHRSRQSVAEVCSKAEIEIVPAPHLALQAAPTAVLSALQKLGVLP